MNHPYIASAIHYFINSNKQQQPSVEEVAAHLSISTGLLQRLFEEWAGTTPLHFFRCLNKEYTQRVLQETHTVPFASPTGRRNSNQHVCIERMHPTEYNRGTPKLLIRYHFEETPLGEIFIATTYKGICYVEFTKEHTLSITNLKHKFPNATCEHIANTPQQYANFIFAPNKSSLKGTTLHLKGTDFQLNVWNALLGIPMGGLTTYSTIAANTNAAKAVRAVGTAIGQNPVALLIPCHRVIRSTGELGSYHWGKVQKAALIGWEAIQKELSII